MIISRIGVVVKSIGVWPASVIRKHILTAVLAEPRAGISMGSTLGIGQHLQQ